MSLQPSNTAIDAPAPSHLDGDGDETSTRSFGIATVAQGHSFGGYDFQVSVTLASDLNKDRLPYYWDTYASFLVAICGGTPVPLGSAYGQTIDKRVPGTHGRPAWHELLHPPTGYQGNLYLTALQSLDNGYAFNGTVIVSPAGIVDDTLGMEDGQRRVAEEYQQTVEKLVRFYEKSEFKVLTHGSPDLKGSITVMGLVLPST